jgi:Alkylmercury lyase
VRQGERSWWGNCAWCSLGIAALLGGNGVSIESSLGADGAPVTVHVDRGRVQENLLVHFPTPMTRIWDNVIYGDSTILFFESDSQIDSWAKHHQIARGDSQPVQRVYELGAAWYGRHLDEHWHKWTLDEARAIFTRLELKGPIWELPHSNERF